MYPGRQALPDNRFGAHSAAQKPNKIAKTEYSNIKNSDNLLDHLEKVVTELEDFTKVNLHIDLGEIQGFKYHNGIVFSAYSDSAGYVLAKGGRYDGLRKSSDQDRPAVGFDLKTFSIRHIYRLLLEHSLQNLSMLRIQFHCDT